MNPATLNRQILLASYPQGVPRAENFQLVETAVPELRAGEVLVKVLYLSIDPYPRVRMQPQPRMASALPLQSVVIGRGAGKVIASHDDSLQVGSYVVGEFGWQEVSVCRAAQLQRVDAGAHGLRAQLGVLGAPGLAAHFALECAQPKRADTMVVTAAAGAVGSLIGQLAKLKGCRVVGLCRGEEQLAYVRDELHFDAAIDAQSVGDLDAALAEAAPRGVDGFLDSVGGEVHNAVVMRMNDRGRLVAYGYIGAYNVPAGAEPEYGRMYEVIRRRLTVRGFFLGDYRERFPEAIAELAGHLAAGRVKLRERLVRGLAQAPAVFAALFTDAPPGKQLIEVATDE